MTPRPLPDRRLPMVAGGLVVVLALPVFLAAGWDLSGWALGAAFWAVSLVAGLLMSRRGIGSPTLRGSGPVAFGMMGRGIVLMVVAIVVASFDPTLALSAALVYAAAYSVELALSLTVYFQGEAKTPGTPAHGGSQR
ncbi:MAG: hypothetical protein U0R69_12805 [Gaiellales bacterium]